MTIQVDSTQMVKYTSVTVESQLSIPFRFLELQENVKAFWRLSDGTEQELTYGTDYTITTSDGTGGIYGTLSFTSTTEIPEADYICIYRDLPISQTKSFDSQTIFSSTTEYALDKLTLLQQDNSNKTRFIHASTDTDLNDDTLELPPMSEWAENASIGFKKVDDEFKITVLSDDALSIKRTIHQPLDETEDPSFEINLEDRKNKILGFNEQGSVEFQDSAVLGVQSDWDSETTTDPSYIKNKPILAGVATSGSYNDLSNKLTAGDNITIDENNVISATDTIYELPVASSQTLGGVKQGNNIEITADGTISCMSQQQLTAGDNIEIVDSTISVKLGTIVDVTKVTLPENGLGSSWTAVAYGNGRFVAVPEMSEWFIYSDDGITWSQSEYLPFPGGASGVVYGNGRFVTCSNSPEPFMYSADGINWVMSERLEFSFHPSLIVFGKGKFVAFQAWSYRIAYSADGINWTQGSLPLYAYWQSVAYGNGRFVAIATQSDKLVYSDDGINWVEGNMPKNDNWYSIAYGNGRFVAFASPSDKFVYSDDGITWTEGSLPKNDNWYSIAYGNGRFVTIAYDSDDAVYSDDGITWFNFSMIEYAKWDSVAYGNGRFVAVAYESIFSNLIRTQSSLPEINELELSVSGIQETLESGNAYKLPVASAYNLGGVKQGDSIGITADGVISVELSDVIEVTGGTLPMSKNWKAVANGNGRLVAMANISADFVYSDDGITWISGDMPNYDDWESVAYGNGRFVAIARNSNRCAYSDDGITWTEGALPDSRYWYSVAYGNGKFVAIAYDSDKFAYSDDGVNWQEGNMPESRHWRSVTCGNGRFVAIAYDSDKVAYSNDGVNWQEGNMPDSRYWYSVAYGNGRFVAIAYDSIKFAHSEDGITWLEGSLQASRSWTSVTYGRDKFVVIGYNTYFFEYSYDGINWIIGDYDVRKNWISVAYANNGRFVVLAYDSDTTQIIQGQSSLPMITELQDSNEELNRRLTALENAS